MCPTTPELGSWLPRSIEPSTSYGERASCRRSTSDRAGETERSTTPSFEEDADDDVGDDLLRLVFVACHPVLAREAQVALTLRLLGGLSTAEIARAFLVPEPTIAQRIVRAKRTLAEKQIPFEVPRGEELAPRLASVLEVVYLIFNEGYSATAGEDWMRPALCEDALRLGRVLAELVPAEPDVHALVALMEIQVVAHRSANRAGGRAASCSSIRIAASGIRARSRAGSRRWCARKSWRADASRPTSCRRRIAACHARAATADATEWPLIAALYAALGEIAPSPVVELNRAVALAMAFGPEAGLELVDAIAGDPALSGYHLLPSVRGDLAREARAARRGARRARAGRSPHAERA